MPINAATSSVGLDVKTPEPGDVSICFNCGEIGIFEDATTIREPTRDERLEIIEDTGGEITEAQIKLAAIHKEKAVFDK